MLRLLFLYFSIVYFDLFFVVSLKFKFGKALPLSMVLLFCVAFICNLFGNLHYYKYIILSLAFFITIFLYFSCIKSGKTKIYLSKFICPSFLIFTLFYFFFYINVQNKALTNIDDLTTWAPIIKSIVKSGKFYSYGQITTGYPPFVLWSVALICYLFGGFSEQISLFAMALLQIAFVLPILDKFDFKKKHILKIIFTSLTVLALMLTINIVDGDQEVFIFNSIYLDWIMSIVYAYAFYLIFTFTNSLPNYINFGLISTIFLFTKQLSLPLYLVLIFSFAVKLFISKSINIKRFIFVLSCMIILYLGWNLVYYQFAGKNVIIDSFYALKIAANTLFLEENIQIIKDYVIALFTRNIIYHPIGFSYFAFNTLLFVSSIAYAFFNKRKKDDFIELSLFYLGSYGYAVVMALCYITMFGDGYSLPLFSRYMQTYTFAYLVLLAMLYLTSDIKKHENIVFFILICLFIEPVSIKTIDITNQVSYFAEERQKIETFVKDEYKGENVLIVGQTQMAYKGAVASIFDDYSRYAYAQPITLSKYSELPVDLFAQYLYYFDYILITDYDDYFANNYWYKMTNLPLYNSTLYKINKYENGIDFEYVYVWDK